MSEGFTLVEASLKLIFGKSVMRLGSKNMKSLIIKFYRKLRMINKLELAAKMVVNFGMAIRNM
jgi:hypothetical protein